MSLMLTGCGPSTAGGGGGAVGDLASATVLYDGWTIAVGITGAAVGTIDPTKLTADVVRADEDLFGETYTGADDFSVVGAASNTNPWYDADNPFPSTAILSGGVLTCNVRLPQPIREGDSVTVTVAAGLVTGAVGGSVTATNNSGLHAIKNGEGNYVSAATMVGGVDRAAGCHVATPSLVAYTAISTTWPGTGGIYRTGNRIFVGTGGADATPRTLSGYDCCGARVSVDCMYATIKNLLFDDSVGDCIEFPNDNMVTTDVYWCQMDGLAKAANGGSAGYAHNRFGGAARFGTVTYHSCLVRWSTGDGIYLMDGLVEHSVFEDTGWDDREDLSNHADHILVPNQTGARVELRYNFTDSFGQQEGTVSPWTDPGYQYPYGCITGAWGIECEASSLPGESGTIDNPLSVNMYELHDVEIHHNISRSNQISYDITLGIRELNGLIVDGGPDDHRTAWGVHIHDNLFSKPSQQPPGTKPLYPWTDPHHRWYPDTRFINNIDETGTAWTLGPQPADATYDVSADVSAATGGDTVTWTILVGRYFGQYGDITLNIAQSGTGYVNSLATDMATAIAAFTDGDIAYSGGVLTISQGFHGITEGQTHEGAYIEVARAMSSSASGSHNLTISSPSVGTIGSASDAVTMTPAASYAGPNDAWPGWIVYYGLRAPSLSAIGHNVIRLRRTSDNTASTFVSQSNGLLDMAAIATFKGASTNLYVVTIYDDISGKHLTPNTNADQPEFVETGGINNGPRIVCSTNRSFFNGTLPTSPAETQPYTLAMVAKRPGTAAADVLNIYTTGFAPVATIGFAGANLINGGAATTGTATASDNTWHTTAFEANGASSHLYVDGADVLGFPYNSGSNNLGSSDLIRLGGIVYPGNDFNGSIVEAGIHASGANTTTATAWTTNVNGAY